MILIGIPNMGTVPTEVMASVVRVAKVYGDKISYIAPSNSLVYDARDMIMLEALKMDADLVFIDSDIEFSLEAFQRLLSHKKPIVSGLYYGRNIPSKPIAYKKVRPKTFFRKNPIAEHITEIEPFMEVEGAGLGFCLIRKEVLRAVYREGYNAFQPIKGLGEDFSFFYRCRKKGYKVYLDTTLGLKHIGRYKYGK